MDELKEQNKGSYFREETPFVIRWEIDRYHIQIIMQNMFNSQYLSERCCIPNITNNFFSFRKSNVQYLKFQALTLQNSRLFQESAAHKAKKTLLKHIPNI